MGHNPWRINGPFSMSWRRGGELCPGPCAITGDFNMTPSAAEKNNNNLNRVLMTRFRNFT
jgi:hypothetical protein